MHTRRRVAVFCGASRGNDPRFALAAAETGRAIVAAGYELVYGGGRIGLMGVLADAALDAGGTVVGVIPRALSGAEIAHAGVSDLHVVDSMHERKAQMAAHSDGFMALPGGFGTLDEFAEMLTWRQLGIHDKPVGLLNVAGLFDPLLQQFDAMIDAGFVDSGERSLFVVASRPSDLLARMFQSR